MLFIKFDFDFDFIGPLCGCKHWNRKNILHFGGKGSGED